MSSCATSSLRSSPAMPSVSMVMQKGQALAMVSAPVSRSWSVRLVLTRCSPGSSSFHICAPPAPQQRPLDLFQYSGSTSFTPGMDWSTSRGLS